MKFRFLIILLIMLPVFVWAQLISIKTVPLASGDQFALFPSQNAGMAGASIAAEDLLGEPFVNPAKAGRLSGSYLILTPTYYRISNDLGSGRTLPFHLFSNYGEWFGGLSMAIQQLRPADISSSFNTGQEQMINNSYLNFIAGKKLNDSDWSVGGAVFWSALNAVQGVDLLYPRSQRIDQSGNIYNFKFGLLREWQDHRQLEILALLNYIDLKHEVTYGYSEFLSMRITDMYAERVQVNHDKTKTWGIHLGYRQPLAQSDWKFGAIFTANVKTHPKIPNYELMNIPRDPGNSWAYNIGLGFCKSVPTSTIALDLIYEPIYSYTWANAVQEIQTSNGHKIYPGQKTVNNDFEFSNFILRFGLSNNQRPLGFQLGLGVHSISYWLDQKDYVQEKRRKQYEQWKEWTASWAFVWQSEPFEMRYLVQLTSGTGRPGVSGGGLIFGDMRADAAADYAASNDLLLAPSGSLTVQEAWVVRHQVSIIVPLK